MKILLAITVPFIVASYAQGVSAAPFELTNWTVIQYNLGAHADPNAVWTLSNGNTVAHQSGNNEPSILLSDFTITHETHPGISGTWLVNGLDDDSIGFVFGYQNRSQFYLFNWKQANQAPGDGGMHLRKINVVGGGDPNGDDLGLSTDTPNMEVLRQNDLPWALGTEYSYHLGFTPTGFTLGVKQGSSVLASWAVDDVTFTSGSFGFYNHSQPDVIYQAAAVPEPSSVFLIGTVVACLGALRRHSGQDT